MVSSKVQSQAWTQFDYADCQGANQEIGRPKRENEQGLKKWIMLDYRSSRSYVSEKLVAERRGARRAET